MIKKFLVYLVMIYGCNIYALANENQMVGPFTKVLEVVEILDSNDYSQEEKLKLLIDNLDNHENIVTKKQYFDDDLRRRKYQIDIVDEQGEDLDLIHDQSQEALRLFDLEVEKDLYRYQERWALSEDRLCYVQLRVNLSSGEIFFIYDNVDSVEGYGGTLREGLY